MRYVIHRLHHKWFYCEYDRVIIMLARGLQTDFIDELNDSVSLYDILSPIMPYSVMIKLRKELSDTKLELEDNKRYDKRLQIIQQTLDDSHNLMEKNMAEIKVIINKAFMQSMHDNSKMINKIEQLQKGIGIADRTIFAKLDEAIMEIKSGNNKSAVEKIMEAFGYVSDVIGVVTFLSQIDFIKNMFLR